MLKKMLNQDTLDIYSHSYNLIANLTTKSSFFLWKTQIVLPLPPELVESSKVYVYIALLEFRESRAYVQMGK